MGQSGRVRKTRGSRRSQESVPRPARDKNFVGLVGKVFDVLEVFSRSPRPIPLEDITVASGLAKTSVHRLLYTLRKLGYVEQSGESSNYSLSGKFFELGRAGLPQQRLVPMSRPILENLSLRCGESVHLGVLEHGMVKFIAVVESQNPYRCAAAPGELNYAHSTALGKVLLAELPQEDVESIIRQHGLPKLAQHSITTGAQLIQELERVRQQGFAGNNEENIDGVMCVGAPIKDNTDTLVAGLSISGPATRMAPVMEIMVNEVTRAATTLSVMLGHTPDSKPSESTEVVDGSPSPSGALAL